MALDSIPDPQRSNAGTVGVDTSIDENSEGLNPRAKRLMSPAAVAAANSPATPVAPHPQIAGSTQTAASNTLDLQPLDLKPLPTLDLQPIAKPILPSTQAANQGYWDSDVNAMTKTGMPRDKAIALAKKTYANNNIPVFPGQAEDEAEQARTIEDPSAKIGGTKLAGSVVGGEVVGAGIGVYRAAKVARELQAINAARQASGIARTAAATEPYTWANASKRLEELLKQGADDEITGAPTEAGGPTWQVPGKLPPAAQDMTAEELMAAKKAALDASARSSAAKLLKSPDFWATAGTATAAAAGGSIWGAMSGVYHMRRTIQFLSHIFGG